MRRQRDSAIQRERQQPDPFVKLHESCGSERAASKKFRKDSSP
jgi:hypothetical protein